MKTKVHTIKPGDTIRFGAADAYYVDAAATHPDIPGLHLCTLTGPNFTGTVGLPADNDIEAVSMPRTVDCLCLLCRIPYPFDIDLVQSGPCPDLRGICGTCNASTTAEVLRKHAEEKQ